MARKSSAVRKTEVLTTNLEKARAALAEKRAAASNMRALVLDIDVVNMLEMNALLNGETPSAVVRRLFLHLRKPGAKA